MVARSSVEVEVRRIEQPARLVDLPRVDLTKNLSNQQSNHHSNIILPDNNQNEPALVLPAHPRPGSTTSSEAGRPNPHMLIRSTPKAEQFEVRIIFLFRPKKLVKLKKKIIISRNFFNVFHKKSKFNVQKMENIKAF